MDKTRYDYGVTFNGRHSTEFDLDIIDKNISMPNKMKVVQSIPHSNHAYDFSTLYGNQIYEQREIEVIFRLNNWELRSKESLYVLWTKVIKWLTNPSKLTKLEDDIMVNYYYMAEVQNAPEWDELRSKGNITAVFTAYPFRIDALPEGHDIWDVFNFELDVSQVTEFDVNGSLNATLINSGEPEVFPQIITNSPMTIIKGNIEYQVGAGTFDNHQFGLSEGESRITIRGNGHIKFNFHKELI